jgi:transposase-like protein
MDTAPPPPAPPFCPNPACAFHTGATTSWRWVKDGFFTREQLPHRVQRYRCRHCGRHFSAQTFAIDYWLKRPGLIQPTFQRLVACSGYRQIAREFACSPSTVATHAARLGRHCLLLHERLRPKRLPPEPLVLDSFVSFEHSQYHPTAFHLLAGQQSHFLHGFTDSELRRSGTMTAAQKRQRRRLEQRFGRPDPRSTEVEVAELLRLGTGGTGTLELHSDEHHDYPRAIARLPGLKVTHRTISSRAARIPQNPLFALNLLDGLIRHSGANHKRETIAFSKRRQGAIYRLAAFLVWRNYAKHFSERRRGPSVAMKAGVCERLWSVGELLAARLFPGRIRLPGRWARYYFGQVHTRAIAHNVEHRRVYAA